MTGKIAALVRLSAGFTPETRIVENTVDTKRVEWRVTFDSGYTIALRADGTWHLLRKEDFEAG